MSRRLAEKFWDRVVIAGEGCWLWDGVVARAHGYGSLSQRYGGKVVTHRAHRLSYELLVGPIPDGMELDHLCRVRDCVRPDHLEPVSHAENVRRGLAPDALRRRRAETTHCPQGHPYAGDNLHIYTDKRDYEHRVCRACRDARNQARRAA